MLDLAITDLETTGLDPDKCGIIEIFIVRAQLNDILLDNEKEWKTFHKFVLPDISCLVSEGATQLTGYNREKWETQLKAQPFFEIAEELAKFLNNSLLTGWNPSFDKNFILSNFKKM